MNARVMGTRWALGVCLLAGGLTAGCAALSGPPPAPETMVVEGRTQVDLASLIGDVNGAAALAPMVQATAHVPFDYSIADPAQRGVMAQAAARRSATRELGRTILAIQDASGKPLGEFAAVDADLSSSLSTLLRDRTEVQVTANGQEAVGTAGVAGETIARLFTGAGARFTVTQANLTGEQQAAFKAEAYDRALQDARTRLEQQIMALTNTRGEPLSEVFQRHPERLTALQTRLAELKSDDVRYQDDGTCLLEIYFDANEARQLASPQGGWLARVLD